MKPNMESVTGERRRSERRGIVSLIILLLSSLLGVNIFDFPEVQLDVVDNRADCIDSYIDTIAR